MNCLKRITLVLALTLFFSVGFSAPVEPDNPAIKDAAILLEEAIYTGETRGDFDGAARIYQQIADNAESGRAVAAQALYRLGRYYEERGRRAEANAAFERLAKQYPEQKELILRVPGLADTPLDLPKFLPAPWEDGEMLTYSTTYANLVLKSNDGVYFGLTQTDISSPSFASNKHSFSNRLLVAESGLINGKKTWKFRSISPSGNLVYARNVLADDLLNPIEAWPETWDSTDRRIEYFPGLVVSSNSTVARVNEFPVKDAVYDINQIIYLIRCLPLQAGFETILPIFDGDSITNQMISVQGRETVVTPAGTFNAWKVRHGNKDSETFYWISDDNYRYPVKTTTTPTSEETFELVSISKTGKNGSVEYEDQDISLSLPAGWFFVNYEHAGDGDTISRLSSINFVDAEYETSCDIKIYEYPPGADGHLDLSKNIDDNIAVNQTRFNGYWERHGSRENITISGLPGIRYIIDRKSSYGERDLIVYTFRILVGNNKAVTAYLRTSNEDFDRFQPVFDSIINSIQFK